jgi:tRNA (cytidine56-2'-O)-methyltransferase
MIVVLRVGHRIKRDERLSTHVGLTARAFGADEIVFTGDKDDNILESIKKIKIKWGGKIKISYISDWKKAAKKYKKKKYKLVHLTMYGEPIRKRIFKIRKEKNILIAVGSGKVPGQLYTDSDYNIAVGNQPHSEVAALAVFLHEYHKGKELGKKFEKSKIRIIPQKNGKKTV